MLPDLDREAKTGSKSDLEPGWLVVCWNDPVNLMTYVTHVFQTVFGWNRQKAEFHMLQVHRQGKSVLARTTMEQAAVDEIKGGLRGARSPKVFKAAGENAAAQGDNRVGSADRPAHARLFESHTNDGAATGCDYAGADKEFLFAKFRIAHLPSIVFEVPQLFEQRLFA